MCVCRGKRDTDNYLCNVLLNCCLPVLVIEKVIIHLNVSHLSVVYCALAVFIPLIYGFNM